MNDSFDRALLQELLDEAARHDPEYGRGLSNHLPMAWLALARLGAGESRLREFGVGYAAQKRLQPRRPPAPWPAGDAWTGRFGQRRAWPVYRDLFEQWIGHEGAADVLAQTLPALVPGVAAAAFHGLIRTAAGVQAGHAGEVAQGLAHWACFFLPLGPLAALGRRSPVAEPTHLLRRLRAGTSMASTIAERMRDAAADGNVSHAVAPLLIERATPERLARAAAFAYAETGNFTALHLVTGTHAMRVLAQFLPGDGEVVEPASSLAVASAIQPAQATSQVAAWRWFWQAYAHGVVAARLAPAPQPLVLREWPEIVATALASSDEHVIKLVDAAREEERTYGGNDWRRAASRAVMKALP